jgi:hypothetical protein
MKNNGSIYIHVLVVPMGMGAEVKEALRLSKVLNKWKRVKGEGKRNLLSDSGQEEGQVGIGEKVSLLLLSIGRI